MKEESVLLVRIVAEEILSLYSQTGGDKTFDRLLHLTKIQLLIDGLALFTHPH